jgi:hypothetical protein
MKTCLLHMAAGDQFLLLPSVASFRPTTHPRVIFFFFPTQKTLHCRRNEGPTSPYIRHLTMRLVLVVMLQVSVYGFGVEGMQKASRGLATGEMNPRP